jgi:hypothetical protein
MCSEMAVRNANNCRRMLRECGKSMAIAQGSGASSGRHQALPAEPQTAGQVEGILEGLHGNSDRQL